MHDLQDTGIMKFHADGNIKCITGFKKYAIKILDTGLVICPMEELYFLQDTDLAYISQI